MAYSGQFIPKNLGKYSGDSSKIRYRSLWERGFMRWCDDNPDVKYWSSEEVIIPYISPVDNKAHRYYMDFKVTYTNGTTMLIEIKPEHQTRAPIRRKNGRKESFLTESKTYAVNDAKWNAAERYARKRGWKFLIFTENTLNDLGIRVTIPKKKKKRK